MSNPRPWRLGVARWFDGTRLHEGDVEIDAGRVSRVGLPPVGTAIAAPGFVDLQVNGFLGFDAQSGVVAAVEGVLDHLPRTGVTACAIAVITAPDNAIEAALHAVREVRTRRADDPQGGARLLGAHLEGPFLSAAYPGAHPVEHLRAPDADVVARWARSGLALVTLAPELPGGLPAIRTFVDAGVVVSLGHTDATADVAETAFDMGARALTHAFNAHRPLTAREPGVLGVALARDDVVLTAIADGVHLAPRTLDLLGRSSGGRIALITDAMVASGLGDGDFRFGPLEVSVREQVATVPPGRLAGSVATMDHCVRVAARRWGLEAALAAATSVPGGLANGGLGRLAVDGPADVVVLGPELDVRATLIGGRLATDLAGASSRRVP